MSLTEYESDNINSLYLELRMHEKRLKIPEGQSEVVNRRKTDKTIAKCKKDIHLQNTTHETH